MATLPDVDRILEVVGFAYESAIDPSAASKALNALTGLLGGCACQLYRYQESSGNILSSQITQSLSRKDNDAYVEHYGHIDPRRQWLQDLPPGKAVRCNDKFDETFVSRSEFYQDFLLKADLRWVTGIRFSSGPGVSSVLASIRPQGTRPFEVEAVEKLQRVGSHFRRAAEIKAILDERTPRSAHLEELLDAIPSAAILVNESGHVIFQNKHSEATLGEVGAVYGGGLMHWNEPRNQALWDHAVAMVSHSGEPLTIKLLCGLGRWRLHVLNVKNFIFPADAQDARTVIVLFEHLAHRARASESPALSSLTPAEHQVLNMLLNGKSPKLIAKERDSGVGTVRSQIASIYSKLDVHSTRELLTAVSILGKKYQGCSLHRPQ